MRRANLHERAFERSLASPMELPAAVPAERSALRGRVALRRVLLVLLLFVLTPYLWSPVYRFPPPVPFSGSSVWNPYAGADHTWLRANLHAHGAAWGGLTNGVQSDNAVVEAYRRHGYDVAAISDYHRIAAFDGVPTLPAYEHGYNISKIHQVAIGARSVEWLDYPLLQWTSQKQFIIDRVKAKADLVALVHPAGRDAYSEADIRRLTGYDLFELLNGRFSAEQLWDAALSSGHFSAAIGDDDTHDVTDPHRMAVAWTMIDAASTDTAAIVDALGRGRSYAVGARSGTTSANDAVVRVVTVRDGRLTVAVDGAPGTFTFIRQGGSVRERVEDVTSASYEMAPDDQYVRTEIETPQTIIYLNPVVRYDGVQVPAPVAVEEPVETWGMRSLVALTCAGLVVLLGRRRR
jgi:hypothetical protein